MKVIERSPIGGDGGSNSIIDRIKGIWQFGLSWNRDIQAQSELISHLGSALDNTYTMIRNVALPGSSLPVPLVLIGETGVRTFYASGVKVHDAPHVRLWGRCWEDGDANGIQDGGEAGLAGVQVTAYDPDGLPVETTTTGAGGYYWFSWLSSPTSTISSSILRLGPSFRLATEGPTTGSTATCIP